MSDHEHSFNEITTFGDTERHYRCAYCGTATTKPFQKVDSYTGVVEGTGFTREDVEYIRLVADAIDRAVTAQELFINLKALDYERGRSLADRLEAMLPPE